MADDVFPRFSSLPQEVRLMIWKASLPGARLVSIRQRPLNIKMSGWAKLGFPDVVEPKARRLTRSQHTLIGLTAPMQSELSSVSPSGSSNTADSIQFGATEIEEDDTNYLDMSLMGIASSTLLPSHLLTCRESHYLATLDYKPAFSSSPALPQTYFNFALDTLYLGRNFTIPGDQFHWRHQALLTLNHPEELWRVKRLAVRVDEDLGSYDSVAEILGRYLGVFGGVERLMLVVGDEEEDGVLNLCGLELVGVDEREYAWAVVRREELEVVRGTKGGFVEGPGRWRVPDVIELKAAVSSGIRRAM